MQWIDLTFCLAICWFYFLFTLWITLTFCLAICWSMLVPEALTGLAWRSSSICPSQRSNSACISSNWRHSSSMSSSWVFLWLTCDKASSQCSCNFSAEINQRPLPLVIFASEGFFCSFKSVASFWFVGQWCSYLFKTSNQVKIEAGQWCIYLVNTLN